MKWHANVYYTQTHEHTYTHKHAYRQTDNHVYMWRKQKRAKAREEKNTTESVYEHFEIQHGAALLQIRIDCNYLFGIIDAMQALLRPTTTTTTSTKRQVYTVHSTHRECVHTLACIYVLCFMLCIKYANSAIFAECCCTTYIITFPQYSF